MSSATEIYPHKIHCYDCLHSLLDRIYIEDCLHGLAEIWAALNQENSFKEMVFFAVPIRKEPAL